MLRGVAPGTTATPAIALTLWARSTREVFASDAIVLLHEAAAGAMRDLDHLAAAASA